MHTCLHLIRPFTVGRKNWFFADTPKGASASAAVYSLVETAKANGLNVFAYPRHLLTYMPGSEWQQYPEELDDLMPWSPQVQEQCKYELLLGMVLYTILLFFDRRYVIERLLYLSSAHADVHKNSLGQRF